MVSKSDLFIMNFFISGIIYLFSAFLLFKSKRLLYPSIVFCVLWGLACLSISFVQYDILFPDMKEYFAFKYMNEYILYFTFVSVLAFFIIFPKKNIIFYDKIPLDSLNQLLERYHFIMYLSFIIGMLRIIIFISLFNVYTLFDYRQAFVTNSLSGYVGFFFRIGNWIQMLADIYIALLGYYHGKTYFDTKKLLKMLNDHINKKHDNYRKVWSIYCFLQWYDVFFNKNVEY